MSLKSNLFFLNNNIIRYIFRFRALGIRVASMRITSCDDSQSTHINVYIYLAFIIKSNQLLYKCQLFGYSQVFLAFLSKNYVVKKVKIKFL